MGKIRDLMKIGDIEGTCQERMGMIKDKNCKDLTEEEDIKKRWQKYTEELCSTGNCTLQYSAMAYMGNNSKKEQTYV